MLQFTKWNLLLFNTNTSLVFNVYGSLNYYHRMMQWSYRSFNSLIFSTSTSPSVFSLPTSFNLINYRRLLHMSKKLFDDNSIPGVIEDIHQETTHHFSRCYGCGATLQSHDINTIGYVPKEIQTAYSDGRLKTYKISSFIELEKNSYPPIGHPIEYLPHQLPIKTRLLICQRCYRLQYYKKTNLPKQAIEHIPSNQVTQLSTIQQDLQPTYSMLKTLSQEQRIQQIITGLKPQSLILHMIDLMDVESSLVPELHEAYRRQHHDIIWVINKLDCLPKQCWDIKQLLHWIRRLSKQMGSTPITHFAFISSKTGYNFNILENVMQDVIDETKKRYIYVVGRTNCGKSTFVNRFLHYIGYKHLGTIHFKSEVGGITQSPFPGSTVQFIPFSLPKGFKIVDTPGVPSKNQAFISLTNDQDIKDIIFRSPVHPIHFKLNSGMSLLIGGIARIDLVSGMSLIITAFFSSRVSLQICTTIHASKALSSQIGKKLKPPRDPEMGHQLYPWERHTISVNADESNSLDDISIAGLGWINIMRGSEGDRLFYVWTPKNVHVFRRPALPLQWNKKIKIIKSSTLILNRESNLTELKRLEKCNLQNNLKQTIQQ